MGGDSQVSLKRISISQPYRVPKDEADALRHHQAALLYNVLEPDWLQKTRGSSEENQNMNRCKF